MLNTGSVNQRWPKIVEQNGTYLSLIKSMYKDLNIVFEIHLKTPRTVVPTRYIIVIFPALLLLLLISFRT